MGFLDVGILGFGEFGFSGLWDVGISGFGDFGSAVWESLQSPR